MAPQVKVSPPPHTEHVLPGDKQSTGALTCWRAGPDCRGPVELRWLDAEQWESLPACERHYAEWRREELAITAAIDAALDEESSALPETPVAPETPTQSREPEAKLETQSALAGVDEVASHIHDDGVSF